MKSLVTAAGALGVLAAMTACAGAEERDLENVKGRDPKKVELYINVEKHPNLVRLCIDGVGFVTSSREEDAILRVPEFDAWCKA